MTPERVIHPHLAGIGVAVNAKPPDTAAKVGDIPARNVVFEFLRFGGVFQAGAIVEFRRAFGLEQLLFQG
jgi:hypothetical protein